jgi:molecular chaperone Hsp33
MTSDNKNIKKKFKTRDRAISVLSSSGLIRAAIIKNTNTAREAQSRHNLDFVSASLLARQLAAAGLCASFLKGEERIIIETEGSGPIKYIYSEALSVGEIRGFIDHRSRVDAENISSFRDAIGIGLFKFTRILYNKNIPVEGIILIQKGDISSDLAHYFDQSEQIPTAVSLDVSLNDDGEITESGGILVQAMPGAEGDMLEKITKNLQKKEFSLCSLLAKDYSTEDILKIVLPFEFSVTRSIQTDFFCRCSLDHFKSKLLVLGANEIEDMMEKGQNELICKYCNEKYNLSEDDFSELIINSKAATN